MNEQLKNECKDDSSSEIPVSSDCFKKPLLIGKIGRLPRKVSSNFKKNDSEDTPEVSTTLKGEEHVEDDTDNDVAKIEEKPKDSLLSETNSIEKPSIPYKEPPWSGLPESNGLNYTLEVLKNGVIVEILDLMEKPFWIFGRLSNSDISMAHPTISRYHAVLQYRSKADEENSPGFYIYDLASTHGTFLNKNKLRPRVFVRVKVGHIIKLGCSTRNYILSGPEEDAENESELSVTELKQKRIEQLAKRKEEELQAKIKAELEEETRRKKEEEKGIDWGLGNNDDMEDEETDLSENPYAQTNNEDLYVNDPKKALRGFMEREGHDLEYNCEEQGFGQFLCRVKLPLDDDRGLPIVAEVLHKGKKKEAVIQCALEACRILDRYGVLRQSTHESRKRKAKDWEKDDYYDSDEDTFLDRTGTIEKKREKRMQAKMPQKAETYESLVEKEKKLNQTIVEIENKLRSAQKSQNVSQTSSACEEDSLDSYMKNLKQSKIDKQTITKLKSDLFRLKQDHAQVIKLANIAKPADLPPLIPQEHDAGIKQEDDNKQEEAKTSKFPIFGKRKKIKVEVPQKKKEEQETEEDEDEEIEEDMTKLAQTLVEKIEKIIREFKKKVAKEDCIDIYIKTLETKQKKVLQQVQNTFKSKLAQQDIRQILNKIKGILEEVATMGKHKSTVFDQRRQQIETLNKEFTEQLQKFHHISKKEKRIPEDAEDIASSSKEIIKNETESHLKESEGREIGIKKKNVQKRMQQKQHKMEIDKRKGYEEDSQKEGYTMWVPPQNQTGDGRTPLNDKLGY